MTLQLFFCVMKMWFVADTERVNDAGASVWQREVCLSLCDIVLSLLHGTFAKTENSLSVDCFLRDSDWQLDSFVCVCVWVCVSICVCVCACVKLKLVCTHCAMWRICPLHWEWGPVPCSFTVTGSSTGNKSISFHLWLSSAKSTLIELSIN